MTPILPEKKNCYFDDICSQKWEKVCGGCSYNQAIDEMAENIAKAEKEGYCWGRALDEEAIHQLYFKAHGSMPSDIAGFVKAICSHFGQPQRDG